jgi:hypothetical protein
MIGYDYIILAIGKYLHFTFMMTMTDQKEQVHWKWKGKKGEGVTTAKETVLLMIGVRRRSMQKLRKRERNFSEGGISVWNISWWSVRNWLASGAIRKPQGKNSSSEGSDPVFLSLIQERR